MKVLSENEINEKLKEISGWIFREDSVSKEFQLKDFKGALAFVNKIGDEAETLIIIRIHLFTRGIKLKLLFPLTVPGGVTQNDFDLDEAEKMDHHPDIFIHSWNKVKITISTHSAGGVTQNDFDLAKKIEKL